MRARFNRSDALKFAAAAVIGFFMAGCQQGVGQVTQVHITLTATATETALPPTATPEPTAIPLPVGSEPTAHPALDLSLEETPTKEILVSKTVSLEPIDQVEELVGIEFDLNPIRQLFPELANIELLAATNGMQGDSMKYVVVIKDGNRLVMARSINHDGQEFVADYPAYFDVQPDGVLTPRIDGVLLMS